MSRSHFKLLLGGSLLAAAVAAPAHAATMVTYSWTTTSQGYGAHVDQPTTASFDVPLADVLTGKTLQSDITNIRLAYPGLTLNSTVTSSTGYDFASFVDPKTGAFLYKDAGQGLAVVGFAGTDINAATTFLSITVGAVAYDAAGQSLNRVADQFNALNNGNAYAGYPTGGYWTAAFPVVSPSVPEPASWALMIAGFGVVGVAMRRRRSIAVRVSYAN